MQKLYRAGEGVFLRFSEKKEGGTVVTVMAATGSQSEIRFIWNGRTERRNSGDLRS